MFHCCRMHDTMMAPHNQGSKGRTGFAVHWHHAEQWAGGSSEWHSKLWIVLQRLEGTYLDLVLSCPYILLVMHFQVHLHSKPWPSQIRKLEVMRLSTDLGPLTNQIIKSLQRFLLWKKCCETDGNWGDNYPSAEIKTPLKPSAGLLDNNAWAVGRPNLSISPGKKETWSSGMYMFVGLIQTNSN